MKLGARKMSATGVDCISERNERIERVEIFSGQEDVQSVQFAHNVWSNVSLFRVWVAKSGLLIIVFVIWRRRRRSFC